MSLTARSFLPNVAAIELTFACNHACRFCSCPWYADMIKEKTEMGVNEWKECLKALAEAGVTTFSFTGGEMLLKKGWEEIVRFASNLTVYRMELDEQTNELSFREGKPELVMLSNGKIMSDEVLYFCKELGIHLSMSLPGFSTFEQHTCGGTTAQHLLNWYKRANELGVPVTAAITATSENFFELGETVTQALNAGADNILINRFLPGGRGLQHRNLELSSEQIAAVPIIVDQILTKAGKNGHVGTEYPYCLAAPAFEHGLNRLKLSTNCGAATGFFAVSPAGMLRTCNHSPIEIVHWRDWAQAINHPHWRSYIFGNNLPEECTNCPHTSSCDGGCREAAYICTGKINGEDPGTITLETIFEID